MSVNHLRLCLQATQKLSVLFDPESINQSSHSHLPATSPCRPSDSPSQMLIHWQGKSLIGRLSTQLR